VSTPEPSLYPYSDEDPKPRTCKNSGRGHIFCTAAIREKYKAVCKTCSRNPDNSSKLTAYREATA